MIQLRDIDPTKIELVCAALALNIRDSIAGNLLVSAPLVEVDQAAIMEIITSMWWSAAKKRVYVVYEDELTNFPLNGMDSIMADMFSPVVSVSDLEQLAGESSRDSDAFLAQLENIEDVPAQHLLQYVERFRQRDEVERCVDMFSDQTVVEVLPDGAAVVTQRHVPYEIQGDRDDEVIEDFVLHFPQFDEFLEFIVASRFVVDRKLCYLWIQADSDWGKNLLLSILFDYRCATDLSVKEAENAFEGKPVGLSTKDLLRSLALVFDEFKTIKAELKQLQNHITISPKFQLRTRIPIYAKIFTSKENVHSLVTDSGIEDQFANRFSYIRCRGSINDRPLFKSAGRHRYASALREYIGTTLNELIEEYLDLGVGGSKVEAEKFMDGWHKRHAIDLAHERFSETLPEKAEQFTRWLCRLYGYSKNPVAYGSDRMAFTPGERHAVSIIQESMWREVKDDQEQYFLKAPSKLFDIWLKDNIEHSGLVAVSMARDTVYEMMSVDGQGLKPRKPHGVTVKCLQVKLPEGAEADLARNEQQTPQSVQEACKKAENAAV